MLTVSAQRLLRGMHELNEGLSEFPDTGTQEFPVYRHALDIALAVGWESELWQSLALIEERYFRANWLAASTYNKTNEVYDAATQQYFQCLRDSVTGAGNSPTDSAGDERSAYWALCKGTYSGAAWLTATVYAVGDIKFYAPTNRYYQCHTAHTSSSTLVPDATGGNERWGVLTPFLRSIDFSMSGQTLIGEVIDVLDADPRATEIYGGIKWDAQDDVLYLLDTTAVRCWVQFRKRRPSLTGALYSATATYAVGDQIYFEASNGVGNFYDCIVATTAGQSPTTTPASWDLVELPLRLQQGLVCYGAGMALTGDEQDDRRNQLLALGEQHFGLRADVQFRQTSRTPTPARRAYP